MTNKLKSLIQILYLSPIIYLLGNVLIPFIQNPYSHPEVNLIFKSIQIHSLTVVLISLQMIYAFWFFRHTKVTDQMAIPFLFVSLTLHVYEIVHAMLWTIQTKATINLLTTNLSFTIHIISIVVLLYFLYSFQKKLKIVKVNKLFICSFSGWIISMLILLQINFFNQLYVESASPFTTSPFREFWALSKILIFLSFVTWFKKPSTSSTPNAHSKLNMDVEK